MPDSGGKVKGGSSPADIAARSWGNLFGTCKNMTVSPEKVQVLTGGGKQGGELTTREPKRFPVTHGIKRKCAPGHRGERNPSTVTETVKGKGSGSAV